MTHTLSITDGTTTNTLTASPWFLSEYVPVRASRNSDGSYEPVAETIELHVTGSGSTTAVQTLVNTVERYLQRARQRQETGHGPRIYLQVQWDGEASTWRSELLEGEAEINLDTIRAWGQAFALFRLHIVRKHYFEGPETLARCVQQYSGQSTSEQILYNTFSGEGQAGSNFLEFSSTQIQGVLPTPAIIWQSNTVDSQVRAYTSMQLALGKFQYPYNFAHWYQGENAIGAGSVITEGVSSGGYYRQILAGTIASYVYWNVRVRQESSGRSYRVLARFRNYSTGPYVYVRPIIRNQSGTHDLWYGEEVQLPRNVTSSNIVDLGVVPIPLAPSATYTMTVQLALGIRASASSTVNLDFVQLTPLDGYRVLKPGSYQFQNPMAIIDDGVDELTYISAGSTDIITAPGVDYYYPLDAGSGNYIMLYPGIAQRLYILKTLTSGALVGDALKTKVYYRPRRLTL